MKVLVILVFFLSSIQILSAQVLNQQIPIRLETPHNWSSSKTMDKTSVYTAPSGYYILSAQQVVHSQNGPGFSSVTTSQANSSLVSLEEVRRTFEEEREFVLNLDVTDVIKADLMAAIDERQDAYEKRYFELASSHSAVVHSAMVRGQGIASFKGRSWYHGSVRVHLVSSAPEFEQISSFKNKAETDFRDLLQQKNIKFDVSTPIKPIAVKPATGLISKVQRVEKVQKVQSIRNAKVKKNNKQ